MRVDILPPVFGELRNQVTNVRRKGRNEWSSSCPQCGGDDRFVLFEIGRGGFPFAFCRQDPDGHRWYPAKDHKLSQSEIDEFKRNQIEVEKARIEASKRTIEILQNDRLWEHFFANNIEYSMNEYRKRGLSDSWIKYLKLGFIPDYTIKNRAHGKYHSPAFTIPIWSVGGFVQNIKLRMADPKEPRDRYRNYYESGRSFLYVPLYDLPLTGAGVVVEGEFKAAVVEQHLDDVNYRVVGLQSKTPDAELVSELKDLDPIYLCLDPDAFIREDKQKETAVERMARLLGKERVLIVDLPCKPDDGINEGMELMRYMKMSRKA